MEDVRRILIAFSLSCTGFATFLSDRDNWFHLSNEIPVLIHVSSCFLCHMPSRLHAAP